jgi:lipopolysaccharide transport system permease protein
VFAIRVVVRNLLALAHNILVIIVVFAVFLIWPGSSALLSIPALLLWVVDALCLAVLLGSFCARFRDIQPIVNSVMQIAFFLTPVIWKPDQLGPRVRFLPLNPFFDLLDIVRAPLLGEMPGAMTWVGAVLYSLLLCGVAWALFARARGRIAFWL